MDHAPAVDNLQARLTRADLFLGPYRHGSDVVSPLAEILARISERLALKDQ